MHLSKSLLFLLIALTAVPILTAFGAVYAQPCQILQFNVNYPRTASAGQSIQVNTTIDISCAQWRTYYSGRVDLVDQQSRRVLSIGTFNIGEAPNITATVLNMATAPQANGPWGLEVILYIFEGGGMVAFSDRPFNIQLSGPITTSQQTSSTMLALSSETVESSTTTSQALAPPQTTTETTTPASTLSIQPNFIAGGGLVAAAIVVALALMKARKRNA